MKILLVEDEPFILMDIEFELQAAGHEVISVSDANRAIDLLCEHTIDVVVTDIDMPGSADGLMLATAVRKRWPPIQIVVMSVKRRPRRDELPRRARFIEKPLHMPDLLGAVGDW